MKVLITGGTGLLGTHLLFSQPSECEVIATWHTYRKVPKRIKANFIPLDVTNQQAIQQIIQTVQPAVIIHTAADSNVDFCEKNSKQAWRTNVESTQYLLAAAKKGQAKIIFCSTNMTFDGLNAPYSEDDIQNPGTVYGKTKVAAEQAIISDDVPYTIVRLMTMYGWNWQPERKNMVSMAIEKLSAGEKLWMTNDVWNNLLSVSQAADFFWSVVLNPEKTRNQIFHISGKDCLNRYQVTREICKVFGFDTNLVTEVSSNYFAGNEAARSPNTCFSTIKATTMLKFKPMSINKGLLAMDKHHLPIESKLVK